MDQPTQQQQQQQAGQSHYLQSQQERQPFASTSTCTGSRIEVLNAIPEYMQANMFFDEKRYAEALAVTESIFKKLLAFRGPHHRETILCKQMMGRTLLHLNRLEECTQIMLEVKEDTEKLVGPTHRFALIAKIHYGGVLWQSKKYKESLEVYQEIMTTIEQDCFSPNPSSGFSASEYLVIYKTAAALLVLLGRLYEALEMYKKLLEEELKAETLRNNEILGIKTKISLVYFKMGMIENADKLSKECIAGFQKEEEAIQKSYEAVLAKRISLLCLHRFEQKRVSAGIPSELLINFSKLDLGTPSSEESSQAEAISNPEQLEATVEEMFKQISLK